MLNDGSWGGNEEAGFDAIVPLASRPTVDTVAFLALSLTLLMLALLPLPLPLLLLS
jgi:hypothetical protein